MISIALVVERLPRQSNFPARIVDLKLMSQLEKQIETRFVRLLKSIGLVSKKMNGLGDRSFPDRMILMPDGKPIFIEFKRPGKEPTPKQWAKIYMLRDLGYVAIWSDSSEAAFAFIRERLDAARIPKKGG